MITLCKIYENIWKSETKNGEHIELNYMTWLNDVPKFDFRKWTEEGALGYCGFSVTEDELREMYDALKEYFEGREKAEPDDEHVIDFRTFLIHSGDCVEKGHDLEEVIASVFISSPSGKVQEVCFRARYCRTCKHYYITKEQFKDLKKKGTIMCQVLSVKQYEAYRQGITYRELKEKSKLNMAGYNLTDGLTKDQRRSILVYCIESGWMTRNEIIGHLNFLIELNESKPNTVNAVETWRRDRDFLKGYNSGGTRMVGIKYFVDGKPFVQR